MMHTADITRSRGSGGERPADLNTLRSQRQLALVGMLFAGIVAAVVLLENFGPEPAAIPETRRSVAAHQKILANEVEVLKNNEEVLRQNLETLANVKKALHLDPP